MTATPPTNGSTRSRHLGQLARPCGLALRQQTRPERAYISPVYGDFTNFPPTILTSGTRDLFLANIARTHRKLKRVVVVAELNVYEGMSHAQFEDVRITAESQEMYTDIARFFDRYLGK